MKVFFMYIFLDYNMDLMFVCGEAQIHVCGLCASICKHPQLQYLPCGLDGIWLERRCSDMKKIPNYKTHLKKIV